FVAKHPDLEGCLAQGETADEAVAALADARRLWVQTRLDDGLPIPEPMDEEEYSGRFVLRLSRHLHARLARRAAKDGVSLNHYVSTALAEHLGASNVRSQWFEALNQFASLLDEFKAWPQPTLTFSQSVIGEAFASVMPNALVVDWVRHPN